jgi:succinyl-CoA synthetase beta subunit
MLKKCITDNIQGLNRLQFRKQEFTKIPKKSMWLLHEYQAQGLLKKYTVPIPKVRNNFKI